jgi:hypothetical protein
MPPSWRPALLDRLGIGLGAERDAGGLGGRSVDGEELELPAALVDDVVLCALRNPDHVPRRHLRALAVEHRLPGTVDEVGGLIGAVRLLADILARLQAHQHDLHVAIELGFLLEEAVPCCGLHHILVERRHPGISRDRLRRRNAKESGSGATVDAGAGTCQHALRDPPPPPVARRLGARRLRRQA